jgi:hypothetical protein
MSFLWSRVRPSRLLVCINKGLSLIASSLGRPRPTPGGLQEFVYHIERETR